MIDIRQTEKYADYLLSLGWKTEKVNGINYFLKKIPLLGHVLKVQRPKRIDYKEIRRLEKKYRVFQTIIEPNLARVSVTKKLHTSLLNNGFKLSNGPYLPTKTLHIDLTQNKSKITASFKKDARRAIKRGGVNFVKEYSSLKEIELFREYWKNSVKLSRYVPQSNQLFNLKKSFSHSHSLFLASHNDVGNIIGGVIFTRSSHDIAYYWQGFTSNEGRTSLSQYTLLYQGILWAKKIGCKIFDFEGIYDPRFPNKSWLGFTHFKKSFGGYEVDYPGAFVKNRFLR